MRRIDEYRAALKPLLPEGAFLRTDRKDALFVTNAPIFDPGFSLPKEAWTVRTEGRIMRVTPVYEDVPAGDEAACTMFLKCRGTQTQKLLRQKLALSMRLRQEKKAAFWKALLAETEDIEHEA